MNRVEPCLLRASVSVEMPFIWDHIPLFEGTRRVLVIGALPKSDSRRASRSRRTEPGRHAGRNAEDSDSGGV